MSSFFRGTQVAEVTGKSHEEYKDVLSIFRQNRLGIVLGMRKRLPIALNHFFFVIKYRYHLHRITICDSLVPVIEIYRFISARQNVRK